MTFRTTTRSLTDFEVGVITTEHYSKGMVSWQPLRLQEVLRETDTPIGNRPTWEYTVSVTGAVLRKDGSVGQVRAGAKFGMPAGYGERGLEQMPADVAALCLGPDILRDWTRP